MSCPEHDAGNNCDILDEPIKQDCGLTPQSGERGMNPWDLVSIKQMHQISMAACSVNGGMERGRLFLLLMKRFSIWLPSQVCNIASLTSAVRKLGPQKLCPSI